MSTKTKTKTERPKPPDHIDGEALLEWHRIVDELDDAGQLDKADRAILTLYVDQWALNRDAARQVEKSGAVIRYPNKMVGPSPFYKVQRETAQLLNRLLNDMGMTAATRKAAVAALAPLDL